MNMRYSNAIMSLPVFFPPVRFQRAIVESGIPLSALCQLAGLHCKAIGRWVNREIVVRQANASAEESIVCEPGDWQKVLIATPIGVANDQARARWALGALAFAIFDGVARASIAGQPWARAAMPRGPSTPKRVAMSNAQRQRRWRQRERMRSMPGASRAG